MLPFEEKEIGNNTFIRTFSDQYSEEFSWHRDREDRTIEAIGETDWEIQLDNCLPEKIIRNFIPKNVYHRVIKGTGVLNIKLIKHSGEKII